MGRVDDDLGNISGNCRLKQRLHACNIGRNKRSHRLLCKLSGRFREQFVRWEVRQGNLVSGGGRESESKHARQSSGGKHTTVQFGQQRPRRTSNPDNWRTAEKSPTGHAESLQDTTHTGIYSLAMVG